jgi:glycosyltransferase involved in cell wall biosynthesis
MISIILNTYDTTRVQRHMTQQCIACINKYTDGPYELILVDNEPTIAFDHEYDDVYTYTRITVDPKETVYASYNRGAVAAKGDILMFIQNDVFVHERTINKLAAYLEDWDVAFPQQYPITRDDVLDIYDVPDGGVTAVGWRDAGLLAITRSAFDKSGGWDERFHNLLGEAGYYQILDDAGISWTDRTNAFVTHIMAANNLSKDTETYNKEMEHDAKILHNDG